MSSGVDQISAISSLAGQPAAKEMLVDLARLDRKYLSASPTWTTPPNWSASARSDTSSLRPPSNDAAIGGLKVVAANGSEAREMVSHALAP
jgi:hypothetical protein